MVARSFIVVFCLMTLKLVKADIDVVRVAAAAYEALGPDLHKIEEDIGRMKSEIFAEMDKHIAQSVKAAVGTTLQDLAPTLLSRILPLAIILVFLPPPARRSSSWPQSLPQVFTG
ncbi:hypothetical protein GBAR_LOCUS5634 [Geodia barretti]|uniref:Uncharacterized protein n=1 Tax=Geodia barretti TaxID=519541 RepID=A0AA35WB17_GEOBA|nr:hypothetical protein GBAR_LOCUS5634 [Geodia barretti]